MSDALGDFVGFLLGGIFLIVLLVVGLIVRWYVHDSLPTLVQYQGTSSPYLIRLGLKKIAANPSSSPMFAITQNVYLSEKQFQLVENLALRFGENDLSQMDHNLTLNPATSAQVLVSVGRRRGNYVDPLSLHTRHLAINHPNTPDEFKALWVLEDLGEAGE